MFLVKIKKYFRGGSKEHLLLIYNDYTEEEDIESLVEDWCDEELSGRLYGYSFEWEIVKDENIINDAYIKELKNINNKIDNLIVKKIELESLIKTEDLVNER